MNSAYPQNVEEFWNACTRPTNTNGLGISVSGARDQDDFYMRSYSCRSVSDGCNADARRAGMPTATNAAKSKMPNASARDKGSSGFILLSSFSTYFAPSHTIGVPRRSPIAASPSPSCTGARIVVIPGDQVREGARVDARAPTK